MALHLQKPYTDSPVTGAVRNVTIGALNFPENFALAQDIPGQVQVTNMTCAPDRPEKFRWALQYVNDIYKNSGIDPNLYTPSRRGASLVCQLSDVYSVVDDATPTYQAALPISGHIVLRVPVNGLLTGTEVREFLLRLVAGLFPIKTVDATALEALFRGSLRPKGL